MNTRGEVPLSYHFSIDDVFDALLDASDRQMPLHAQPWFNFLAQVHERFGTQIHLYVFYQRWEHDRWRTLDELSPVVQDVLRRTSWLHFGPHALDADTPPYTQTLAAQMAAFEAIYTAIAPFAPPPRRSPWVRLHYFSEAYELAAYFHAKGVTALLSTDKPAVSYRLPPEARDLLGDQGFATYQGMTFIRSHCRVETFVQEGATPAQVEAALASFLAQRRCVVVFTHGYELARPEVQSMTLTVLQALQRLGARSI
ncbi:MAG: hypothetical protein FJZ47_09385 [Candidatus Tectomicrobia bacterium]|uniref:Uncharacterized protein n=1 Tax=Tectimicrobiota bacterium TaxID=2528274 RepID=A0A937VZF1_UNCTE|nr:hypothetical protein [Candidatus Tectomicrobia bacterium]